MRCRGIMEPSRTCVENQMLYVVAFEEGAPFETFGSVLRKGFADALPSSFTKIRRPGT